MYISVIKVFLQEHFFHRLKSCSEQLALTPRFLPQATRHDIETYVRSKEIRITKAVE
jgi:hypothetical protein